MKVLITGSRKWTDYQAVYDKLACLPKDSVVIEGEAPSGGDLYARTAAIALGLGLIRCPADWNTHGQAAGAIRNRAMLDLNPDIVLAFRIGQSPGTTDCIEEAKRRGIPVEILDR